MSNFRKLACAACVLGVALFTTATSHAEDFTDIGRAVTAEEITGWDIDVRPDGKGLPAGQGSVETGEEVYMERCAHCHGEFGYGGGSRYPQLVGGEDTLTTEDPRKTIGSYWPYASTLFDYIKRAMPFGEAQTLSNDEVYALSAFLFNINGIIEDDAVMNAQTLPAVVMPNADGFIDDNRPDVKNPACMSDCVETVTIESYAKKVGVTPEDETEQ